MDVKYKKNTTFLEARKIVESYMKVNTYANVAQKVCPISSSNTTSTNNNNQLDKYRSLIKKRLQLELNNLPKFQEQLKNLHSAEICETETKTQIKQKEPTTNTLTTAKNILQRTLNPQLKQVV